MPHGLANGILVPYVMDYNLPVCADAFARISVALGEAQPGMTTMDLATRAIELVRELFAQTGFPRKIPADVATEKDIPEMVKQAMTRPMIKLNRRRCSERELAEIYRRAMAGWE
jgi:alcohol dehydrogenase class IV